MECDVSPDFQQTATAQVQEEKDPLSVDCLQASESLQSATEDAAVGVIKVVPSGKEKGKKLQAY